MAKPLRFQGTSGNLFFGHHRTSDERIQCFSLWSDGAKFGFDAHILWPNQFYVESELYRRWGDRGGYESSSDGSIVQVCGNLLTVTKALRGWMEQFYTPPAIWVMSIQEVAQLLVQVGLNRVPVYDILTGFKVRGIFIDEVAAKAINLARSRAVGAMRLYSYVAMDMFKKLNISNEEGIY